MGTSVGPKLANEKINTKELFKTVCLLLSLSRLVRPIIVLFTN